MRARAGYELTVRGRHEGDDDQHGEILQVEGAHRTWSAGRTGISAPSTLPLTPR
jgi:hypothetical protein